MGSRAQIIIRGVKATSLVLLAALWVAPPAARAETTDRVSKTLAAGSGKPIRIDATIADLVIVGSARPDIAVEILRRAPSAADLEKFPAVIDDTGDAIRVGSVQAADGRDPGLKAEISVRMPAALAATIRVFEGRVRVSGLRAACDAAIQRGAIEAAALAGRVRLESSLGSVDIRDSELTPGGMMRLRVFNGPLRVHLPRAPTSVRILAVTFNGTVKSDIPLTTKDTYGPRFGETTIGAGDPVMSLDVVKGDIEIKVDRR
jgi:hypothetical protein